ncbi:hypothetical protein [Hymenobacter sp. GOD-10R]|uniref:toxin-antitoxin system YwqK family antitoxin n=1 Tax=Hymenobacter sp. GOD-10R TaxID=3093922 RepID=UPI002D798012|nr:hypothetical protein [Hymenobacter sp. GOD-10R]WRQ31829.1 hypothetical protein SD425_29230 [Hymenobacter sp. GOD-10R]
MHVVLLGIFLPLPLWAQRAKPITAPLAPPDTLYFDQDWERTQVPEDRQYARIVRHTADGKPTGTVRDYFYPSWKKQWQGKLVQEAPDVPSGLCTAWYETGQLHFRGTFVQGERQRDYQQWHEDGRLVQCRYTYQDALPVSTAKLHSYYNSGSSRTVFVVNLPEGTVGAIYKLDVRDEGQPPISWSTALVLGAVAFDPTMTTTATLLTGAKALASQNRADAAPAVSTQCHWYITDQPEAAKEFMATKGRITNTADCYRVARNITQETRELSVRAGTQRLYVCVDNNNEITSATATLSVSALVQACK